LEKIPEANQEGRGQIRLGKWLLPNNTFRNLAERLEQAWEAGTLVDIAQFYNAMNNTHEELKP
jgi:hypothetical protein